MQLLIFLGVQSLMLTWKEQPSRMTSTRKLQFSVTLFLTSSIILFSMRQSYVIITYSNKSIFFMQMNLPQMSRRELTFCQQYSLTILFYLLILTFSEKTFYLLWTLKIGRYLKDFSKSRSSLGKCQDKIGIRMLKRYRRRIRKPLTVTFQDFLSTGQFPVVPFYRNGVTQSIKTVVRKKTTAQFLCSQ